MRYSVIFVYLFFYLTYHLNGKPFRLSYKFVNSCNKYYNIVFTRVSSFEKFFSFLDCQSIWKAWLVCISSMINMRIDLNFDAKYMCNIL